jgi:nitroreductase
MEFIDLLKIRHSNRWFKDEQISKAELDEILLAGCAAPIGSNLYKDIHITVVRDKKVMEALNAANIKRLEDRETMRKIAAGMEADKVVSTAVPFYGAPTVIIVSHRNQDLQPGIEYANATCVVYTMHLAAANLGLGSVFIWGILEAMRVYPELDASGRLNLPEGFSPLMGLMVGRPQKQSEARELKADKIPVNYI